ncbi:MAG: hypothetical protein JSU70_07600 [Phycisphaerales bacterium]|nr:MAG: hypothetical protein JSU70_07600 [Phycisphaerales bacterium]
MAKVLWSAPKMTQRCQSATDLRLSHKGGTAALAIPRTDVYDSIVTIQLSAQPPGFWVVKEVRAITKDADTSVTALALSHDGSRVAWTDRHRIYIVDTGMPTKRRQILNRDELEVWLPGAVRHLRFHPNANDVLASSHGAYLVEDSADRPGIVVWDTDNGRPLQVLPGLAGGTEFSPDGRLRHSHIMHYVVDRGVPLPIVQKQVGHRSLKTTSVYLSASTEKMAKAYRAARQRAGAETGPRLPGDPSGPVNQCGEPA